MDGLDGRWFDPWRSLINYLGAPGDTTADWIGRANGLAAARAVCNGTSLPIRFVPASQSEPTVSGSAKASAYELLIHQSGEVPTRTQGQAAWHDYFNALVWLAWPQTKQIINRRQAEEISTHGVSGRRGALRDALTLFDESAVLFVSESLSAIEDLEQHNWRQLFVAERGRFEAQIVCVVIGHALLQKLMRPYKSVCGHTLALQVPAGSSATFFESRVFDSLPGQGNDLAGGSHAGSPSISALHQIAADLEHGFAELDATVAARLARVDFGKPCLTPVPVLGIPGWWQANQQPEFYNDSEVFRVRTQRMRSVDSKETKA